MPEHDNTHSNPEHDPVMIELGLHERAFFSGMSAAQTAGDAVADLLHATTDSPTAPFADTTVTSFAGGRPGIRELAAFFWMMIGAQMSTIVPALIRDAATAAATPAATSDDTKGGTGDPIADPTTEHQPSSDELTGLQQVFLHGAMTRAPLWLEPAFELSIPTFDVSPFQDRDGERVGDEAVLRLVTVALQRTWGRISDGDGTGPVYLDSPHEGTWVQVGTFRIRDAR